MQAGDDDGPAGLPRHIPQLDGLRGVACLQVLVHHYVTGALVPIEGSATWYLASLSRQFMLSGVDLLFVLSGFLIGGILIDERGSRSYFSTFYIRRACRILPVYVVLVGSFALIWALGLPDNSPHFTDQLFGRAMPLWTYATFTQNFAMAAQGTAGALWVGVTWSLAVEEQFYMLFPLIVCFTPPKRLWLVSIAALMIAPLCRLAVQGNFTFGGYVLLPCRMDTLIVGVIVAQIVRDPRALAFVRARQAWLAPAVMGLGLIVALNAVHVLPLHILRYSALAAFYGGLMLLALIKADGLFSRALQARWLIAVGAISYAVYMYHQAVNGMVHGLLFSHPPTLTGWPQIAATLTSVLITLLTAALSYRVMERPIRAFGRRFSYRGAAVLAPAAT